MDRKEEKILDSLTKQSESLNVNAQKVNAAAQNLSSAFGQLKSANDSLGNPVGKGIGFISQKIGKKDACNFNSSEDDSITEKTDGEATQETQEQKSQSKKVQTASGASNFSKALAVFFMIVAVVYTVSPIDLSPDAIPVVGWFDDVGALLTAGVNAIQQFAKNQESFMVKILKYIKWFMVIGIVIAALLLGGLIAAIVALATK